MFYLDWMLTLIVFAIYPFAVLPMSSIGRACARSRSRTHSEIGDMTSRLSELLAGARLIKAFRLENYATERLNGNFEQIFRLRMKAVRARGRSGPALEALAGLVIAGVIAFAYWRIAAGISTVGDFMGFVTALLLAAQPIKSLGSVTASALEGLAAADRIYELLDEKPTVVDRPGCAPAGHSRRQASCSTTSDSPMRRRLASKLSKDFSLTVPGGKTVALVGRSGAGKSTVINLVARLFDVDTGRILIDGQDLRDVTLASLQAGDRHRQPGSDAVRRYHPRQHRAGPARCERREEIVAAAKAAAAHEFIMAQPQGYDTTIGDGGLRLSGGQRQRLALAAPS